VREIGKRGRKRGRERGGERGERERK